MKPKESDRIDNEHALMAYIVNFGVKPLLEEYSKFLEEHGYMDADWWAEEPLAIDRFIKNIG